MEKKLRDLQLDAKKPSQIAVINITENFNFKENVETIINNAFTLDNLDVESSRLDEFNVQLKKLCDRVGASVKEVDLQTIMKKEKEWDKENRFNQTLYTERGLGLEGRGFDRTLTSDKKGGPTSFASLKKKFEDLNGFSKFGSNGKLGDDRNFCGVKKSCLTPRNCSLTNTPKVPEPQEDRSYDV